MNLAEQGIYVELVEDDDVIHGAKSSYERGTGAFGEDGAAFTFEFAGAGIGIDADYEQIAFSAGASR